MKRKPGKDMQISFSLPESQFVTESPEEATRKIRMFAALGLYQSGEISAGAASELAGIDRYEFLEFCKREGVVLRTQTPDELEEDIKKFRAGK
jgi:predicted HTH domain antitoxin